MTTQRKIAKWENSLGLRVPREIAARVGLTEGALVDIETDTKGPDHAVQAPLYA